MARRIVSLLVLVLFINTITYFPDRSFLWAPDLAVTGGDDDPHFDGDTLIECILDDFFGLMAGSDPDDPDIFHKKYRAISSVTLMPIRAMLSVFELTPPVVCSLLTDEFFFPTKIQVIPGYYSFLFRLKPF